LGRYAVTIVDPSTPLGKIRLRTGDWQDLPLLPDAVIQSALDDCNGNVPRASSLCAQYILATLTAKTHRKLAQVEIWGREQFDNYVTFLKTTVLNPHLMSISPIPYAGAAETNPLVEFMEEWNKSYCRP
jgi:hypothetical protein